MISNRFVLVTLAMAGCAATAYALGRRTRKLDRQVLEEDVRNWEDEGGNLAPVATQITPTAVP